MPAPKDPIKYKEYIDKLRRSHLGYKQTEEHKEKIRQGNLGKIVSFESREKMKKPKSIIHRENISKARKGMIFSKEHIDNIKKSNLEKLSIFKKGHKINNGRKPWNKDKKCPQFSGEKASQWKGGITPLNNTIRGSLEYKIWSRGVMCRDNFIDAKTGIKGGKLVAHHIQNFSKYPELRFSIKNGITFSKESHDLFHKIYGKKNNTRGQLEEFLGRSITS